MRFRPNVAALIKYQDGYLSCCRSDYGTWQCVQGGIEVCDVSPWHAIMRELREELGLQSSHVTTIAQSCCWRRYFFTKDALLRKEKNEYYGQEQMWFFLELQNLDAIRLEDSSKEFSRVALVTLDTLLGSYAVWKRPPVHDFCREMGLIGL